jgi:23S rRNA (uracil1939-C5)-methyltransferase
VCGGCSLQHLETEAQLAAKQQVLQENLQHIGKVRPETILPPLTGPVWHYRRKARLGARLVPKKGGMLVGFRERAKSYIADMLSCEVLDQSISDLLPELRTVIAGLSCARRLPQVEVAVGDEDAALVFRHLEPLTEKDHTTLRAFGEQTGMQIHLQPKGLDSVRCLWPENPAPLSYTLPEFDVEILFRPTDFIQVNGQINRRMVHHALELLAPEPDDTVLDLFCGLGNFSLPLARQASQVTAVEMDALLIERARQNAVHNGIDNVTFVPGNLDAEDLDASWLHKTYDRILLDPPRTGAMEMVKRLGRLGAGRVVYVSCNPATLARDSEVLVHRHGYHLKAAGVMDMFPHTTHVESIAVFDKTPA